MINAANAKAYVLDRGMSCLYSPNCREEVFSETELPGVVILESVLMVKETEPQRWEHQNNPPLGFIGLTGSA